ncbi:hypothetical protein B0H34DRAFT_795424 [Crassisporium funariophilum]|nr:hypothetical protein B0H34DRAFT_795424 [Crassisporium funariophilum]
MSQVKLNLQPPPNVDFVTGYPGIPPGAERPQAAVKGAIEVRLPAQGVKAKWVRIELRKVETLPGGGPANTFYDFVGPSPVNLWSTSDEYSVLRSQDFPFSIRIPESIPPSIALDNRAGIGYELVASVCTKGKKGFLRKAKSVVVSTVSPIIIDKHELHSTWPVYCQPETRHLSQEGVNLIVERNHTCYGPGDRISVVATVKSDNLHTVILRGFEFFLKESTVFRAGVHSAGKKSVPQERLLSIAESKVAVNATLYGGTSHTSELSCTVSPGHTTTTLNAARHIDVTYTLCIKALMGTGTHLVMELPVIISNWQRHVSYEAINRIGPAPSLSLLPATQAGTPTAAATRVDPIRGGRPADQVAATLPLGGYGHVRTSSANAFNSLPGGPSANATYGNGLADEFGEMKSTNASGVNALAATVPVSLASSHSATAAPVAGSSVPTARRPGSAGGGNRFTITNAQPQEIPQDSGSRARAGQATGSGTAGPGGAQRSWPSAEEEKKLYEQARQKVAKVQGPAASPPPASLRASPPPQTVTATPPRAAAAAAATPTKTDWMSAEEEKRRFQQATAAVAKTQGSLYTGPPATVGPTSTSNDSDPFKAQASSSSASKPTSAAATLYAQAISAQTRAGAGSGSGAAGSSSNSPTKPGVPQYLTAEQEKAALRRYEEAKRAVDRTQGSGYEEASPPRASNLSGPIAYESLFPSSTSPPATATSSSRPGTATDAPPPFDPSAGAVMSVVSEKERLRRAYEAQDAAAVARQNSANATPPPAAYSASPPPPGQYANALEEKEALRRKFDARDNANKPQVQTTNSAPQPPPPRSNSVGSGGIINGVDGSSSPGRSPSANASGFRPTPAPPTSGSGSSRVLTAAEEKALLRAKYDARDTRKPTPVVNGTPAVNGASPPMPSTPPPLMPRPPVEYIKETQEEDARVSRLAGEVPMLDGAPKQNGASGSSSNGGNPPSGAAALPLDMKPFTPFRAAFDSSSLAPPGPPPPLPRKAAGE